MNIEQRVTRIVAEQVGKPESLVNPENSLVANLGCDSLDSLEILMAVEDDFALDIPDHIAEKCVTVQDVIDLVKKRTGMEAK